MRPRMRDATNGGVVEVLCLFCRHFGKEEGPDQTRKRKRTEFLKAFSSLRTDNYRSHHENMHATRWREYTALPYDEKKSYFTDALPVSNMLNYHFSIASSVKYTVSEAIVRNIIQNLFFTDDAIEGLCDRQLQLFRQIEGGDYEIHILKPVQFELCIAHVAVGLSFRQTARIIQNTRDIANVANLAGVNGSIVGNFTRAVAAINLQTLSTILGNVWSFSIALDCSKHQSTLYLDVRLRVASHTSVHNLHLAAVPVFEGHSAASIFDLSTSLLDNMCPSWRDKLIGVSTDGEAVMTGRIQGVATRFEEAAMNPIYRIWCWLHQLDLVLQKVYCELMNETFYQTATTLISFLRRQYNLHTTMGTTCPALSDTRWLSMEGFSTWILKHRVVVMNYLAEKNREAITPSRSWWITMSVVHSVASMMGYVFTALQAREITLPEQVQIFRNLLRDIVALIGLQGPHATPEFDQLDPRTHLKRNGYSIVGVNVVTLLQNQGMVFQEQLTHLLMPELGRLIGDIGAMFFSLREGVSMVLERAEQSQPSPPIYPFQLATLSPPQFSELLMQQKGRIQSVWDTSSKFSMERCLQDVQNRLKWNWSTSIC